jgi:hypothetical protein
MGSLTGGRLPFLHWGVASAARAGEERSGDLHLVRPCAGGALIGVVDGLGHGLQAAAAADHAVATLDRLAESPMAAMVQSCHAGLRGTRGVVMGLALVGGADDSLAWLGVGNVEAVLARSAEPPRPPERLIVRGGVVGFQLPPLQSVRLRLAPGDVLVLATDGIQPDFAAAVNPRDPPERLAETLLRRFARPSDDALVLVARYLGNPERS